MTGAVLSAVMAAALLTPALAQESDAPGIRFEQPPGPLERRSNDPQRVDPGSDGSSINFQTAPPGPSEPLELRPINPQPVELESNSLLGEVARLRMLDKLNGRTETFEMAVGETVQRERLILTLRTCRFPPEDEKEDAFAFLEIRDEREDVARFDGWMFASSPALNALDHARYDVWVLSCSASSGETSGESAQKSE